ncbi:helix-turn-helix transcriptional regulator [Lactobacillus paragasseri]|uniref:helix-turn-helix domain-containing protein n=1 Tax=Lactobacillus paragasseri TaxID=2107999 RepID=UPI0012E1BC35|nr:helix-turn-helix transcriptional regulator [Lactobacillus paragasseri]MDK8087222.1 helix-turn-helix transcriptional regulator [Lactobacillus paragasseri]MDX5119147.1 helix-turn-helix transcriptional regulator [Lactobacillus paragasseri]MDX5123034.1 helix-turn-helix transcriptional regulator [Lactobacillus paragasseri]QGT98177.1 helix-turn-helix transcriptional regulator [Lactobacillus paragasseri]UWI47596.1 helix-turn-helix transcriptional regulator [Lactobacillus paragasseri]
MNNENLSISYNKLWKLLIDRGMKKKELQEASGISASSIAKLGRNGNVTTDVLLKICIALDCDFSDVMEIVKAR